MPTTTARTATSPAMKAGPAPVRHLKPTPQLVDEALRSTPRDPFGEHAKVAPKAVERKCRR